jgi:oleandomycin transport system ATP-binding protein
VVVRRLDEAGVLVAELTLRSASLNEVFLSLTGHPAEDPGERQRDDDPGQPDAREGVPA